MSRVVLGMVKLFGWFVFLAPFVMAYWFARAAYYGWGMH